MFERFKLGSRRRSTKTDEKSERDEKTSDSQYHAVSLILPSNACDAAKALNGKRFLASEAPIFPVDRCDVSSCSCGYQHYDDRRDSPRRVLELGISEEFRTDGERRDSSDRRHEVQRSDEEPADEPTDKPTDYFIYVRTRE